MKKYVLVNAVTAISLILGLIAIYLSIKGYLYYSFGFALIASVFDSLDGLLARLLKAESKFGAIFDTVADIVVYILYPAIILLYKFGLNSTIGSGLIVIFIIAGIYRLIRFTNTGLYIDNQKKYYIGMPVFFSHILILIMIVCNNIDRSILEIIGSLILATISVLMVSRLKFRKPASKTSGISISVIVIIAIIMFNIQQ